MNGEALNDAFYAGLRSADLPYVVNDEVEVTAGAYAGRTGAVVVLDWSGARLRYLVEFSDGTDELLPGGAL